MKRKAIEGVLKNHGLTVAKYRRGSRTAMCPVGDWLQKFGPEVGFELLIVDHDDSRLERFGIIKPMRAMLQTTAFLFLNAGTSFAEEIETMQFPPEKKVESAFEKILGWFRRLWTNE